MNNIIGIISGNINISKKERIISVAGGIALVVAGIITLEKNPAASWTEIATGAVLLLRGTTGHCLINAVLDRNTAANELVAVADAEFEMLAD